MKLLIYYPGDLTRNTGTPIRVTQITQSLASLGVDIHLLADVPPVLITNIQYHNTNGSLSPLQNLKQRTRELIQSIRRIQPELVYGQTHGLLYSQVFACRITHTPLVLDLHSDFIAECDLPPIKKFIRKKLEHFALRYTQGLTVVSDGLKECYQAINIPIEVIHGGVNTEIFSPDVVPSKEIMNLRLKNSIVVSYIGNFRSYQGIDTLLTAAKQIIKKNPRFLFIFIGGDTPQTEKKIKGMINKFKIHGQVHLLGKRTYQQIPHLLSASDILVVPRPLNQITRNAYPSKLPEYMAMGKAVIATDVGDASQLIQSGKTGTLVPPSDIEALAKAILDLENDVLRHRLGLQALEFIRRTHSWDILGKKILKFLYSIQNTI